MKPHPPALFGIVCAALFGALPAFADVPITAVPPAVHRPRRKPRPLR